MTATMLAISATGGAVVALVLIVWLALARPRVARRPAIAFREVFLAMHEPALVVAPDGRVLEANPAAEQLLGSKQCRGQALLGVEPQLEVARRAVHGRQARHALAGDLTGFEVSVAHLRDGRGRRRGSVLVVHDERGGRAQAQRLEQDSHRDVLTGIANRRGFEVMLASALELHGGSAIGVAFIDLDSFKPINDRLGHAAGDVVLKTVAGRLESMLRDGDTIARLGGDEFALLLPGITPSGLASIPERIAAQLAKPIHAEECELHIGASVGLASAPRDGVTVQALLEASDQRMYREKRAKHAPAPLRSGPAQGVSQSHSA